MKKMNTNHLVSLLLNEPLNYERMLEIPTDELDFLKDECDAVMKDIKNSIIKEYEAIKPSLVKMRDWKHQLRQLKEKREIYKTFISIDRNASLFTNSSVGSSIDVKPVSFSELFRDIENDKLIDETSSPKEQKPVAKPTKGTNTPLPNKVQKPNISVSKIMKPVALELKKTPFNSTQKISHPPPLIKKK